MDIKKLSICIIIMLQGTIFPIDGTNVLKKWSMKFEELKKHTLCFKKKEGCTKKEILAITAATLGLLILVGSVIKYTRNKPSTQNYKTIEQIVDDIEKNPRYALPDMPKVIGMGGTQRKIAGDQAYELIESSNFKVMEDYAVPLVVLDILAKRVMIVKKLDEAGFKPDEIRDIIQRLRKAEDDKIKTMF